MNWILARNEPTPVTEFVNDMPRQKEVWHRDVRESYRRTAREWFGNDDTSRYLSDLVLEYLTMNGWYNVMHHTTLVTKNGVIASYPRWEKEGKAMAG